MKWLPYSYVRATEMKNARAREFVIDRCGRYLSELMTFSLAPQLTDASTDTEAERIRDYVEGAVLIFQQLMKAALDNEDELAFCRFARQMETGVDSLSDLSGLTGEVELPEAYQKSVESVGRTRGMVVLALEAWLLHLLRSGRLEASSTTSLRACLSRPQSAAESWRLFLDARRHDRGQDFGWSFWESSEFQEGQMHALAFDAFLAWATALRLVEQGADFVDLDVPDAAEARFQAQDDSDLMDVLRSIADEEPPWVEIAGPGSADRAGHVIGALRAVASAKESERRAALAIATLSTSRLNEIASNVRNGWRDSAVVRLLFEKAGSRQAEVTEADPDLRSFGVSIWDLKELYVEESDLHTSDWGSQLGRSVGQGENELVLANLTAHAEVVHEAGPGALQLLDEQIAE